jgi:hypothetical protein
MEFRQQGWGREEGFVSFVTPPRRWLVEAEAVLELCRPHGASGIIDE